MGLLASGAAHELGTPLSTLSVLIGDWKKVPAVARDGEWQADLADMDAAVQRCKTIVGGILMSAGEAQIGRAHVCTPVTNAHLVCRPLLDKTTNQILQTQYYY